MEPKIRFNEDTPERLLAALRSGIYRGPGLPDALPFRGMWEAIKCGFVDGSRHALQVTVVSRSGIQVNVECLSTAIADPEDLEIFRSAGAGPEAGLLSTLIEEAVTTFKGTEPTNIWIE